MSLLMYCKAIKYNRTGFKRKLPQELTSLLSRRYHLVDSDRSVVVSPTAAEIAPLLEEFAKKSPHPLTLEALLSFGRPLTSQSLLESVHYVLSEVPRLFAYRVRNLEDLPFIVGLNPFISRILAAHRRAFQLLATYPPVRSIEENTLFTQQLEALVQAHANDIPNLAKGFQECARYMTPEQISEFLDFSIRNRIAVRLIAEQHIALSRTLGSPDYSRDDHTGIVHWSCSPKEMVKMCGSFVSDLSEASLGASPKIILDGDVDATFAYIPVHLEYTLTEILKNAFRASVERHQKTHGTDSFDVPPVRITIASPSSSSSGEPRFLTMRIRDEGGGVSKSNIPHIFSYSFTTAGRGSADSLDDDDYASGPYAAQHVGGMAAVDGSMGGGGLFSEITGKGVQVGMGTIAGLGYGLPMSRLYARYFGGSLDFVSLDGWGSDIFLKLRSLDCAEGIDIW